ncbi:MAG: 30S ribosomal protein S1 [Treponema sp.]|nr:30S ribosomal protein S1 [Treponema sp.]
MVIAIDGPAGTGKSTIAMMLTEKLQGKDKKPFTYINSGNLYRAITLGCLRTGIASADCEKVHKYAKTASLEYKEGKLYLEEEMIEDLLHNDEVDKHVSLVSAIVPVRHVVNDLVRKIAAGINAAVEGRDMTTVVFPNAECRFYLDASIEERAKRRYEQGVSRLGLEDIEKTIAERDSIDRNKTEGSLYIGEGVIYLDTSGLTLNQVYDTLLERIQLRMKQMEVDTDTNSGDVQSQLQEEYLKSLEQLEEGQLIDGRVIQVTQEQVFIDVGYKSEGKIPISEFSDIPEIGDTVSVILVSKENKHGEVIVSKQKADVKLFWKNLRQAFQDHTPVEGIIEKQVKGGFDVNLGAQVHAFLPISQSSTQKVEKPENLIGLKAKMLVERIYSDGKVNIVVNRRKCMEEEVSQKQKDFFENTSIGSEINGVVKSFTSFGAFIDLGGFDGLLHINDMSWGHVTRPKDFVKKGQEIKVKVIRIDPEEKRINLSLKHFTDDPWVHFEDKYQINSVVKGRVTKLAEFGAFIELEEGIEGLAHISEFSWVKKIQSPGELLSIGDQVECMILGYDLQAGRVSLGLKQVNENPWATIQEKYPVGTRLTRNVVKITNAGAFIELEEGIDGFLHGDDISWTKKIKHPGSELSVGRELEVMVIAIDRNNRNIKLGIKQLTEDPWRNFAAAYKPGSQVDGEVSSVTDFGVFVKVPGGIEGLIHKSNLSENREESPEDALKRYHTGDKITAVVLELQPEKQKASFSIRDYRKKVQRDEISRYMAEEKSGDSTFTLGDILKSKGTANDANAGRESETGKDIIIEKDADTFKEADAFREAEAGKDAVTGKEAGTDQKGEGTAAAEKNLSKPDNGSGVAS